MHFQNIGKILLKEAIISHIQFDDHIILNDYQNNKEKKTYMQSKKKERELQKRNGRVWSLNRSRDYLIVKTNSPTLITVLLNNKTLLLFF